MQDNAEAAAVKRNRSSSIRAQRATYILRQHLNATCNVQHTSCNMQLTPCNAQTTHKRALQRPRGACSRSSCIGLSLWLSESSSPCGNGTGTKPALKGTQGYSRVPSSMGASPAAPSETKTKQKTRSAASNHAGLGYSAASNHADLGYSAASNHAGLGYSVARRGAARDAPPACALCSLRAPSASSPG